MTLAELNALDRAAFVAALGHIFEHSPWVAAEAYDAGPFGSADDLHREMCDVVARAGLDCQLALIRAHPRLAGRAAISHDVADELTADSRREQTGAGLDRCTPDEFARLSALNAQYDAKFEFPFILAVRGHTRETIIANLAQRVSHDRDAEIAEALRQIERIALFRLTDLLS